jgi:[acyl-carrier-protein] S-malonyltransferase
MMTGRLAILCPGQGAQHSHMFDVLGSPAQPELLADWQLDMALGMPLVQLVHDEQRMFANRYAQPLLVAATLAAWETVRSLLPPPAVVAGYSIGELSAHAVAGTITPSAAVMLAAVRAEAMDRCTRRQLAQGLAAVSGLRLELIRALLPGELYPAIETGDDAMIVGGERGALARFEAAILQAGGRVSMLPVEVASHTPLMQGAVHPFLEALQRIPFQPARTRLLAGISAAPVAGPDQARDTLARQLTQTIAWADCMDACVEAGITAALELGPGSGLSRLFQARHPDIPCRSLADFRTPGGVRAWLERQGV